jgi:hypothetical protein
MFATFVMYIKNWKEMVICIINSSDSFVYANAPL